MPRVATAEVGSKRTALGLGLVCLLTPVSVIAAPPIVDVTATELDVGPHVQLLEDPEGTLTASTALAKRADFVQLDRPYPNLGLTQSVWWVLLKLRNPGAETVRLLELKRSTYDDVRFFQLRPGAKPLIQRFGRFMSYAERPAPHRNPLFRWSVRPGMSEVLLRIESRSEMALPIQLWAEDAQRTHETRDHLVFGFLFGATTILAIYHLILFIRMREWYLLIYSLNVTWLSLWFWFVNGLAYGTIPELATKLRFLPFAVFAFGTFFFALLFGISFLNTQKYTRGGDRALRGLVAVLGLVFLYSLVGDWYVVNNVSAAIWLVQTPTTMVVGIICYRRGHRAARWFIASWAAWTIGTSIAALWLLGLISYPVTEILHPLRIAVFVEATGLAFAISEHIDTLTKERTEARILAETQAQLVQSEKDAVVGRLVAGLLHEINTPVGALRSSSDTIDRSLDKVKELSARAELEEADAKKMKKVLKAAAQVSGVLHTSASRIGQVVESLKRFANLDESEETTIDLNDSLRDVLLLLKAETPPEVVIEAPSEALKAPVFCNAARMNQAILNLIKNAITAVETKGEVKLGLRITSQSVELSIQDNGKGISPAKLDEIFELGFTTKRASRVGMRLGLPTAKRTIESAGGTLQLFSTLNEGTTAKVTLPLFTQAA